MPEDFTTPIGIRSASETQTWSLVVNDDGQFELRSNSPIGQGEVRLSVDDDTGRVVIGTSASPSELAVSSRLTLEDTAGTVRAELNTSSPRLQLRNEAGAITGMMGGSGNMRAGSNGENGDLYLYPAAANNIFNNGDATVRLNGANGDIVLGGNGTDGNANLRDETGTNRARLSAEGQRLEVMNANGDIIGMLGGGGNVRAGSNGENGDLFLYPEGAGDIFNNSASTVRLNGANGDLTLGGNNTSGNANLRDGSGTNRARLSAEGQRLEVMNAAGDVIGMMGGGGNVRAGSNGEDGDVFLYRRQATNIFSNSEWAIRLSADDGRLEIQDRSGNVICMLGANGNLRMGGHTTDGDILLYPSSANDIFDDGEATIHLDANAGDITLRNADCAEEFEVAEADRAVPGTVMSLGEGGVLVPSRGAYDRGVIGVVSGAGDYKPGIVLDRQSHLSNRRAIALMGKTFVLANDEAGAITVGDLLTTSSEPGTAMKVRNASDSVGAVIGKAIGTLDQGQGMIPMVITLQ